MNGLTIKARTTRPMVLSVTVAYPGGRVTRYPRVPLWTYGLMWIWALGRKGVVIDYLKRLAPVLKPETIERGKTAAEQRSEDLRTDPGDAGGFAAELARIT